MGCTSVHVYGYHTWYASSMMCFLMLVDLLCTKARSGLPPLEAPIMIAEKRKLFFSFCTKAPPLKHRLAIRISVDASY